MKLEYFNQIDKLAYGIEEGARLDRYGDKISNEEDNLNEEKQQLEHMKNGLSCADTYVRKLRDITDAQKGIIKASEKDLENQ